MNRLLLAAFFIFSIDSFADRAELLREMAQKSNSDAFEKLKASPKMKSILMELSKQNSTYTETTRNPSNPPKSISKIDREWIAWQKDAAPQPEVVMISEKTDCFKAIHELVTQEKGIAEVFIIDRMGANLCSYPPTSDYDQGDEDKWFKPFLEGESPYYGKAAKDKSTGLLQLQTSFVIKDGGKPVGVVVFGSKVSLQGK